MKLNKLTERIWVYPYEEERDRPNLCYIHGDRWSLVVDAGHSVDHTREFYQAIEGIGLPLPELTVLTHWHWDHTFGMHSVHGLCLTNERTNQHLKDFQKKLKREGTEFFFALDMRIRHEYEDGKPVIVTLADLVFRGEMLLDAGNCPIRLFEADSPHTDDSTLIEVIEEKVLIMGDSVCGKFPEWTVDPLLAEKLANAVQRVDPEICVIGHSTPLTPDDVIHDILGR